MIFGISNICSAFNADAIGSMVIERIRFLDGLKLLVQDHDFEIEKVPGQALIQCDNLAKFVSPGDSLKSDNIEDYILRSHRGEVGVYMLRCMTPNKSKTCAVVVYTMDAYSSDPEIDAQEVAKLKSKGTTHVLVAVLASDGDNIFPPLTAHRLVSNLAGGNKEALVWTADEIRARAKESNDYWSKRALVASRAI